MLFCGVPTNNDEGTVKKNKKLFYITSGPVWQAGRQGSLKTSESGPGTNCCCKNHKIINTFCVNLENDHTNAHSFNKTELSKTTD